jgi:hypothetical protein
MSPERAASRLRDLLERHGPSATRVTVLDAIMFPKRK